MTNRLIPFIDILFRIFFILHVQRFSSHLMLYTLRSLYIYSLLVFLSSESYPTSLFIRFKVLDLKCL